MATNIPPHNLRESIAATIAYIEDPEIDTAGLMQHIKGPDFPTGGVILGVTGIREAYETGRGRVRVRARAHSEDIGQGKEAIIVTELPFMVKKGGDGGLIRKIAELVHEKKITEISDLRDESDRKGMRIVIELKRGVIPKVVLNKLYKHTAMQTTFGVNAVALVDNVPRTLPLRSIIHNYVQHQREVIVRRSKHELRTLEAQVHRLEGLLIALDHLDAVIELIRGSRDRDVARAGPDGALRPELHPGPGDPRAAPAAADRARGRLDQARARRQGRADPRAARAARRRGQGPRADQGGARPRSPSATATTGARRSRSPRTTSTSRTSSRTSRW